MPDDPIYGRPDSPMPTPNLDHYNAKRDFAITAEPRGAARNRAAKKPAGLSYVIQKHAATRLHYDFRLELDGVLLSWAVPKGPSFDPKEKRMAVHVEDHPVDYGGFEGTIPPKQYGAGTVIVWDRGTWEPVGDPREGMEKGKLVFRLHGEKLAGLWELVRIRKPDEKQDPWMLFKKRDEWAQPLADYDVVSALPDSVIAKPLGLVEERAPRAAATPRAPASADAGDVLVDARKVPLPETLEPQLATLVKAPPTNGEWSYEIKYDGYRILSRIDGSGIRLLTRNGNDWTAKMKGLAAELATLGLSSAWLDGEIVVLDDKGAPSFNRLQKAFDGSQTTSITYFVFDAPFFEGYDLRSMPLASRRALLKQLFDTVETEHVRFSVDLPPDAAGVLAAACQMGLEGVMAKRVDAPYVSDRSDTWVKLKCVQRQEFVIGGFTVRSDSKNAVGSLLLGVYDAGELLYAGSVGTGWDTKTAGEILQALVKHEVEKSPFSERKPVKGGRWSKRAASSERWVKPTLVAEVSFGEWTPDGSIRHASFQGMRLDKPAAEIRRDTAASPPEGAEKPPTPQPGASQTKVSNPERVIDPSTGITKLQLVRYYESVADWILPHLKGRPVSLVRGPSGITGELFFQKHNDTLRIKGVKELDPALWPGHAALLEIGSVEALLGAAQMNVIEFHTWNANVRKIDKPDRVIFDLDPGEGTAWSHIQEAALLTQSFLGNLGLTSFLKTSGGKGLHVVVPLTPKDDWETVKGFSQAVVQHMAKTIPSRFVAKSGGTNRVGKIFIDYLRNGHGQTTAAAFSARSRPGLGVSMPVSWEALGELKSGAQWTVATAREYLSFQKDDPWASYGATKQTITAGMKTLGFAPKRKG